MVPLGRARKYAGGELNFSVVRWLNKGLMARKYAGGELNFSVVKRNKGVTSVWSPSDYAASANIWGEI